MLLIANTFVKIYSINWVTIVYIYIYIYIAYGSIDLILLIRFCCKETYDLAGTKCLVYTKKVIINWKKVLMLLLLWWWLRAYCCCCCVLVVVVVAVACLFIGLFGFSFLFSFCFCFFVLFCFVMLCFVFLSTYIVTYWSSRQSRNRYIRSKISGYSLDRGRVEFGAKVTLIGSRWMSNNDITRCDRKFS